MNRQYKRNFLSSVLCRIDFPVILSLQQSPPAKFQEVVTNKFPFVNEDKKIGTLVYDVERDIGRKELLSRWIFSDKEKNKKIFIQPDSLILEWNKYSKFEEFKEELEFIIKNFFEIHPVGIIKRIGLRYINQIVLDSGNPFEWKGLIHDKLISHLDFVVNKEQLARSMHLIVTNYDDYSLSFQYGLFNSEYPSPIFRKEFTLDYDCYTREEVEEPEIIPTVSKFNEAITNLFEESILDDLRKIMEGKNK